MNNLSILVRLEEIFVAFYEVSQIYASFCKNIESHRSHNSVIEVRLCCLNDLGLLGIQNLKSNLQNNMPGLFNRLSKYAELLVRTRGKNQTGAIQGKLNACPIRGNADYGLRIKR